MAAAAAATSVLSLGSSPCPVSRAPVLRSRRLRRDSTGFDGRFRMFPFKSVNVCSTRSVEFSCHCIKSSEQENVELYESKSIPETTVGDGVTTCGVHNEKSIRQGSSFVAILAIAAGVALTITFISIRKQPSLGSSFEIQSLADYSSSALATSSSGFTFKAVGYRIILPEYAPGWVYFWLLMAAGCGLFISEEALNIWVGITLGRLLSLDGTWHSFSQSFTRNATYIVSTVLWVYWGVCVSDLIPFFLGKLFRQSGASDDVYSKLGIGKDKVMNITRVVQNYGNLSGFVERFSVGMRNPTAFLAGAMGVSPECFFAGVCCGGLITLPIQLVIGCLLRKRPIFAVATVATAMGIWSLFPYVVAGSTALVLYLRRQDTT
ncbi:hypothetical protein Drorol1_Dr00018025 [Drosera rotundifolia]